MLLLQLSNDSLGMNTARIDSLLQLIQDDPSDPFLKYALALEYSTDIQYVDKAIQLLKQLRVSDPDYLPLYYQLGTLLKNAGETREALQIVELGMQMALDQQKPHVFRELDFLKEDLE
jgi:tetratricopeptide (TPR) repeat protein